MSQNKEVKVFKSVSEIGKDAVDSLSQDPFFTYGWFKTVETQQSFDMDPFYIAVYGDGELEAIAPLYLDRQDHFFIDGPKIMPFLKKFLNLGEDFGFWKSHVLLCYSPFCMRSKILSKAGADAKLNLNLLSEKIDSICKERRILFSSFLFTSEFDEVLINNLESLGYSKFDGTTTLYLDVKWSTFEDYLASFKSLMRHNIRREIRQSAENGVTIKETEFKDLSEKMSNLVKNLISKHSKTSGNIFDPGFFDKLDQYASDKTKLFTAAKNDDIIGFSLCLRHKDVVDVFMCGFDYENQTKADYAYFNLCYYAPIKWSIDSGIKKIYYRRKSERAKIIRGCKVENIYSFVKCHDPVLSFWIEKILKNSIYSPSPIDFLIPSKKKIAVSRNV